jgi:UDP-N-acetylmuramyl pentapeptide phosphotransferase/UDP-N-acetylglucosamine-1-phosphate transferase
MGFIILAFIIAAVITYLAIPVIINIAIEKKLVDIPDARKHHKTPVPSLGGIGIFAGFIMSILLTWPNHLSEIISLQYITAATLVIFFLGLKDDIVIISPLKKFIGQLFAAWIIIYKCKLQITSFYGVFGIHELPNIISLGISYLAIVLIINSFNLIDGVDGLSGTLAFICAVCFAFYFYNFGSAEFGFAIMASALAGALASFLIYNHHPAKIFMGDTGSLLIGMINAVLLFKFISLSGIGVNEMTFPVQSGPIIGLSFLFIPLFDTIRVFSLRILKARSPFSPDRNHVHHILIDKGLSHNRVTLYIALTSILVIALTFLFCFLFNYTVAIICLTILTILLFTLAYFAPKKKQIKPSKKKPGETNSKLVNLARNAML